MPFTEREVRRALKRILRLDRLDDDMEAELLTLIEGYRDHLRTYARAIRRGDMTCARGAQQNLFRAPSARIICFILGYSRKKTAKRLTYAELKFEAAKVNPRKPSGERVYVTARKKRSGAVRFTCSFGPLARAAQRMIEHVIFVGAGPSPFEYARRGRGREVAIKVGLHAVRHKGVRWFGIIDVKDFFPSVTREMVAEAVRCLPGSVIEATVFIHDDTDISFRGSSADKHTFSRTAIHSGLPQGSLASLIVASKVLQPHFEGLGARLLTTNVDNILIGGKTQEEVQSMLHTLASSLGKRLDAGSLRLTSNICRIGDPDMDYLGYRIRRRWRTFGGFGRAMPSERSRQSLCKQAAIRMLLSHWAQWEAIIEKQAQAWTRSFPQWDGRFTGEFFAVQNLMQDLDPVVWSLVKERDTLRPKWKNFQDFGNDLHALAQRAAEGTPRLFTKGGPQ